MANVINSTAHRSSGSHQRSSDWRVETWMVDFIWENGIEQTVKLIVRSVQRQWDSGGCQEEVGSVPCVDCLMERRGAQHSEYERTQSATQRETAGMQQHRAAYMFKEAAAERAVNEHVTLPWSLQTLAMFSLWNLYFLLPLSLPLSLQVSALTGENVKETDPVVQHLPQPSNRLHGSGFASVKPLFGPMNVDFLLNAGSSSEESDGQGVIGEYTDSQESTKTSLLYPNEKGLFKSRPTESSMEDITSKENIQTLRSSSGAAPPQPTQEQTFKYQPAEISAGSILHSTQTGGNQLTLRASQNKMSGSHLPFPLFGSLPSETQDQQSTSPISVGSGPSPDRTTAPVATGSWEWTTGPSQENTREGTVPVKETGDRLLDITNHRGAVGMEAGNDDSTDNGLHVTKTSGTLLRDGKQEKLGVCNVITGGQSEGLPLCSMADPPGNGLHILPKSSKTQSNLLPLSAPPSPPHKSQLSSLDSLGQETDSTVDLRPPSPIDLSRSIDQALFSESLFSHSIFGLPRLFHASSSHSLSSPSQGTSKKGPSSSVNALYRTSSCGDVDQEKALPSSRCSQPHSSLTSHSRTPEQWDWKGSASGSTQGLCSNPKETGKLRSHSWANRGQNFAQHSLPRGIPHLSYHRRYRTLSLASQDIQSSGQLSGTKHLSESKQLEWDLTVQAEFVTVCRQIDALSVCSDTIEL
ncbi:hypothetical protein F2P81_007093 [Scophthalmus maximus]|uniref:Uncharacterized protein n=1 Tax=Scophthalmus maximus TaxID=52904 RepID=A0A6A4T7P4_SCOMX|nr:hypothetical protein F2P81_007093 [Scophthalmus maximus]